MPWQTEFGDDYEVPPTITNDPELVDVSWHNDACPSFEFAGRRLWVEHPIPTFREVAPGHAFAVTDGELVLWAGDNVVEAVAALKGGK